MSGENGHPGEAGRSGGRRPISEAEVLAVVEQIADPSETIGASRDSRLAERLDAMRLDRDALVSLGEVSAPEDLLEAAIGDAFDGVDREVLAGLAKGEPSGGIPVSKILPMRDRLMDTVFDRPVRWLVSAAAALLLLFGAGAFLIAQSIEERTIEDGGPLVALDSVGGADGPLDGVGAVIADGADGADGADAVAEGMGADGDLGAGVAMGDPGGNEIIDRGVPGMTAVASLEDAVALLREGRLAVRVRHRDRDAAVASVAGLGVGERRSFRVELQSSESIAALVP